MKHFSLSTSKSHSKLVDEDLYVESCFTLMHNQEVVFEHHVFHSVA